MQQDSVNKTIHWRRNAILFLGGQALSIFGSMLVQYAIFWHITLQTGSGSVMTIYVLVALLPIFFVSPFGGVWADRFNRKNLISLSDGSIAVVTLLIAIAFFANYRALWLIFVCATVRAIGQGVQSPAVSAFIPQIVPEEHLTKINGINTSIQSGIAIIAPVASGALLSFLAIENLLFIDIVTAITGICILQFFVKIPFTNSKEKEPADSQKKVGNYLHDFADGMRYIWKTKFVFLLIMIEVVLFAAISPSAFLTPLQVTREYGNDIWRLTAIEVAFSCGMMFGGLIVGFWGGFKNKIHSMALSCALSGIGVIALGILSNFWLYLFAMFFIGLTVPLNNTPCTTLLQTKIAPEYTGRVFGVFGMTYSMVMPLAMLFFGPLADVVSINYLLVGSGIVILILCIPYMANHTLREAGKNSIPGL